MTPFDRQSFMRRRIRSPFRNSQSSSSKSETPVRDRSSAGGQTDYDQCVWYQPDAAEPASSHVEPPTPEPTGHYEPVIPTEPIPPSSGNEITQANREVESSAPETLNPYVQVYAGYPIEDPLQIKTETFTADITTNPAVADESVQQISVKAVVENIDHRDESNVQSESIDLSSSDQRHFQADPSTISLPEPDHEIESLTDELQAAVSGLSEQTDTTAQTRADETIQQRSQAEENTGAERVPEYRLDLQQVPTVPRPKWMDRPNEPVTRSDESVQVEAAEDHSQIDSPSNSHIESGAEELESHNDSKAGESISSEHFDREIDQEDLPGLAPEDFRAAWEVDYFRWPRIATRLLRHEPGAFQQLAGLTGDLADPANRVVFVSGLQREQGRTTLAVCLARWAAENGKRTLLIDADLNHPQLARWSGLEVSFGWQDVSVSGQSIGESLVRCTSTNLSLLPMNQQAASQLDSEEWTECLLRILSQAVHHFDLIVVDAGMAQQIEELYRTRGLDIGVAVMVRDVNQPHSHRFTQAQRQLTSLGVRALAVVENFGKPATDQSADRQIA